MARNSTSKAKKTTKPKVKSQTLKKTKRNTKDSVFTHLFSFPKYQLELYKTLHPEDEDVCEADIGTITRECVVATHEHNDLGILIKKKNGSVQKVIPKALTVMLHVTGASWCDQ